VVGDRDLDRVGQFSTIDDADAASTTVLSVEDWMLTLTATATISSG
jgi:hypothetical protein